MAEKRNGGKGPKKGKEEDPKNNLPITLGGEGVGGDDNRGLPVTSPEQSSEIQAAILLAKKFPRNEGDAQKELLAICDLPNFAEGAYYSFPRGRKLDEKTGQWKQNIVSGPSIRMAREAARIFGNFRYGFVITHEDDDGRAILAWAWDVEKNNRTSAADYFKKLILRRVGTGPDATTIPVTADERELRELTNRRASILMRNCLLALMPSYFVDNAVVICKSTVAGGGQKADMVERVEKMKAAFAELGITIDQLNGYLKKPVDEANQQDLSELRGIYESLVEGVISPQERAELFAGQGPREAPKGPGIDEPKLSEADMRAAQPLHKPERTPGEQPFPLDEPTQQTTREETTGILEETKPPQAETEGPKGETKPAAGETTQELTTPQKKALSAALKGSGKTQPELYAYMAKRWEIASMALMTHGEYEDALGWASFKPPTDSAPAKKKAPEKKEPVKAAREKADGVEAETDPKAIALKMISEMTRENKLNFRAQVIGLCNAIKGTDNIVEVTIALGKKEKDLG